MVCYMLYGCDQTNEYGLSIFDGMLYGCDQTNECGLSILDGMLYVIWFDQTNECGLSILDQYRETTLIGLVTPI
jgi:hypothetical protein